MIYLGRVIDKENHIFCTRERGIYHYDPETGTFDKADETYVSDLRSDGRKRPKILHDEVLNSIGYRNKDTLYAMVQYYLLTNTANDHAKIWYDGNYAKVLYPKANLTSQRISDFPGALGRPANISAYFDAHIAWIKKYISDDPAVLIHRTGLPNNIHFPLTAVSDHNGKVSQIRMTTMVQRDSGYPLLFRVIPRNVVNLSTITRTLNELFLREISADFVIMDAGYYTNDNIEELYTADDDFLTRLPSKYQLYQEIVRNYAPSLKKGKPCSVQGSLCLSGADRVQDRTQGS